MSLSTDLRARMQLIPSHWEQHKLYARCLTLAEAVEKLPEPDIQDVDGSAHAGKCRDYGYTVATAVEKLKEMVK